LSADLTGTAFFELTGGYGNRKRLAGGLIQAIEVVKRRLAMNREAHSAA
jgi:hypothetical protein